MAPNTPIPKVGGFSYTMHALTLARLSTWSLVHADLPWSRCRLRSRPAAPRCDDEKLLCMWCMQGSRHGVFFDKVQLLCLFDKSVNICETDQSWVDQLG